MNYLESRGRDSLGISINFVSKRSFIFKTRVNNKNSLSIFNKKIGKKTFLIFQLNFQNVSEPPVKIQQIFLSY